MACIEILRTFRFLLGSLSLYVPKGCYIILESLQLLNKTPLTLCTDSTGETPTCMCVSELDMQELNS